MPNKTSIVAFLSMNVYWHVHLAKQYLLICEALFQFTSSHWIEGVLVSNNNLIVLVNYFSETKNFKLPLSKLIILKTNLACLISPFSVKEMAEDVCKIDKSQSKF